MFRKTLNENDKFPVRDCEILTSPIQMQVSLKSETFNDSFVPFLESTSNFKHFETNIILIDTLFRKLLTVKDLVTPLS